MAEDLFEKFDPSGNRLVNDPEIKPGADLFTDFDASTGERKEHQDMTQWKTGFRDFALQQFLPAAHFAVAPTEEKAIAFGEGIERAGEGVNQASMSLLENIGILKPGTAKTYTEQVKARRETAAYRKTSIAGTPTGEAMMMAGEIAPWALVPQAQVGTVGRLLYAAMVSATAGATQFVDEDAGDSRLNNTLFSMITGLGFQGFIEATHTLPKWYANKVMKKAVHTPEYKEGEKIVDHIRKYTNEEKVAGTKDVWKGLPENRQFDLGIEEMTGLPSARQAKGAMLTDEDIADELWGLEQAALRKYTKYYGKVIRQYNPNKPNPQALIKNIDDGYKKVVGEARKYRNTKWQEDWTEVENMLGNKRVFNTKKAYDIAKAEYDELMVLGEQNSAVGRKLKFFLDKYAPRDATGRVTGADRITAKEYKTLMSRWGKLSDDGDKLSKSIEDADTYRVAKRMFGALKETTNDMANNPKFAWQDGAKALQVARDNYRVNSDKIKEITHSSIGKLFDKDLVDLDVNTILNKIRKFKAGEIRYATRLLDSVDPQVMEDVRGYVFRDAFKSALDMPKPGEASINTKKLWKELPKGEELRELLPGQNHARFREEMTVAIKAAERLSNRLRSVSSGQISEKSQAAIHNMVQRNPGFFSRWAAKIYMPSTLKVLATTEGRKAMQAASTTQIPAVFLAAGAVLFAEDEDMKKEINNMLQGPKSE